MTFQRWGVRRSTFGVRRLDPLVPFVPWVPSLRASECAVPFQNGRMNNGAPIRGRGRTPNAERRRLAQTRFSSQKSRTPDGPVSPNQMERSTTGTLDTGLRIRLFEPRHDEGRCQEIYTKVRASTFSWVNPKKFKPSDFGPDTVGESLLVADHPANGVIGFVGIWMPENFIHHLYVLPEFHRSGIGRALLDSALRTISRPAKLKCQSANKNARDFYQHLGWREGQQGHDEIGRWIEYILD